MAADKCNKNGKGITFNDLLSAGLASHKEQAQITLKHSLRMGLLFSLGNYKPQQYYPACLKSEISKTKMSKNIPIEVTQVGFSNIPHFFSINNNDNKNSNYCNESVIIQSLEGYVLPLLPSAPLYIHKMQFKLKITPECYAELGNLSIDSRNKGKEHVEVIGNVCSINVFIYLSKVTSSFFISSSKPSRKRIVSWVGRPISNKYGLSSNILSI